MSSHLYLYVRVFSYLPKRWFLLFSCSAVLFWMGFASLRSQNMRRFFTTLRCTICPILACVGDPPRMGGVKGIINPAHKVVFIKNIILHSCAFQVCVASPFSVFVAFQCFVRVFSQHSHVSIVLFLFLGFSCSILILI